MKPAVLLLLTSAAALMLAAAYQAQRLADDSSNSSDTSANWADELDAAMSTARDALMPSPVADMQPSDQLKAILKSEEGVRLQPYRLGDGGWSIGYGHYIAGGGPAPAAITQAQAEVLFDQDLEARAARWVRAYVTVPLTQNEFDALVSMAYNLRPSSFKNVADAVNAGDGPEDAALQYVRAGTNLEDGLRARRAREFAMYEQGVYA